MVIYEHGHCWKMLGHIPRRDSEYISGMILRLEVGGRKSRGRDELILWCVSLVGVREEDAGNMGRCSKVIGCGHLRRKELKAAECDGRVSFEKTLLPTSLFLSLSLSKSTVLFGRRDVFSELLLLTS